MLTDAKQIELLTPASITTVVAHSELLRFRLIRPPSGGNPGEPVSEGIVNAELVGGARNGAGFDTTSRGSGHGLGNMQARAQRLGATFRVDSRPGSGTRIVVTLPAPPPS